MKVVLPQPDGPTSTTNSPRLTVKRDVAQRRQPLALAVQRIADGQTFGDDDRRALGRSRRTR